MLTVVQLTNKFVVYKERLIIVLTSLCIYMIGWYDTKMNNKGAIDVSEVTDDNLPQDITYDLSELTNVDYDSLSDLFKLTEDLLSHRILEVLTDNPSATTVRIKLPMIGSLVIECTDVDKCDIKLAPSSKFIKKITQSCTDNDSSLYERKLNELISNILHKYDEL